MKKKIEEIRFLVNDKLTDVANKIQKAEDGIVGCLTVFGIVVVSYAVGYRNGMKRRQQYEIHQQSSCNIQTYLA